MVPLRARARPSAHGRLPCRSGWRATLLAGAQTGAREQESLQISTFETISKTVSVVRRIEGSNPSTSAQKAGSREGSPLPVRCAPEQQRHTQREQQTAVEEEREREPDGASAGGEPEEREAALPSSLPSGRLDLGSSAVETTTKDEPIEYVADAVDATIAAMEGGPAGRIYNVGGGSETTLRQALALFERLAGRRLDVHYEPTAAGDMRRTAAAGDMRRTAADTTLIRSELGWVPRVSLEDGVAAQLAAAT
jgi:hypothetical protein